jgi:hypothetical protein
MTKAVNRSIEYTNIYDVGEKLWWADNDHPFCFWNRKNFVVNEDQWNVWVERNVDVICYELKNKDVAENYAGRIKGVNATFYCSVSAPSEGEIEIESISIRWDLEHASKDCKKLIGEIDDLIIIHKEKSSVYLLVKDGGDLDLRAFEINKPQIDLKMNYDDEWNSKHEYLINQLNMKEKKGIVLLHGLPGTGKTMYIRHLISLLAEKRTVIYLPNQLIDSLTDPSFIPLLSDYNGSVIVIEDADEAIRSRKNGGASVDKLLNLADGILSDFLGIQFICTFNCPITTIDEALLRKGRLIFRHEFEKLSVEKSQALSNHLGFDTEITVNMSLAEIYNQEKKFGEEENSKKNRIGFY